MCIYKTQVLIYIRLNIINRVLNLNKYNILSKIMNIYKATKFLSSST